MASFFAVGCAEACVVDVICLRPTAQNLAEWPEQLSRCDLEAEWERPFQDKRVDGKQLLTLLSLFRSNITDYLSHVKSQHGVEQYGLLALLC